MRRVLLGLVLVLLTAVPATAQSPGADPSPSPSGAAAPVGHEWQPIIGPFADGSGFGNVTAWDGGFAMVRSSDTVAPEIWRSRDGRRWRSRRAPTPAGEITWIGLWASGPGLVHVQATGSPLGEQTLTFWRSANGRAWDRLGSLRLRIPRALRQCMLNVEGVGETPDGFAVIADICRTECCGRLSPGVVALAQAYPSIPGKGGVWTWTSPTGRRWTRTATKGVGVGRLSTVTQASGGLVAVLRGGDEDALMRSADGITWSPIGPIPDEVDTQNLMSIQPAGDALVFVGDVPLPPGVTSGNATRVWRVDAAGVWTQVLDLPGTFVLTTAGEGETVLLAGVDQGYLDAPDHAWTRLSRDGGETWEVSAGWPGMAGICFGSVAIRGETAVATTGCTGARSTAPTAWVTRLDGTPSDPLDPLSSPSAGPGPVGGKVTE